jgi:hypothetical protein
MKDYNGWKNQETWCVSMFHMLHVEEAVKRNMDVDDIKYYIISKNKMDKMNIFERDMFQIALANIDWETLANRAKENIEQK